MRRRRREGPSDDHSREALALPASLTEFRLSGQALEWADGCSDDRSGSEKLTE
jgi:hypothetical protein